MEKSVAWKAWELALLSEAQVSTNVNSEDR